MRKRIAQELGLLRKYYPDIEHMEHAGEDWFRIPGYAFPAGWRINDEELGVASVVFRIIAAYPTGEPYAFFTPAGINFSDKEPANTTAANDVPFDGAWRQFSWSPDGWAPTADVRKGSNLAAWVRSFALRLKQGV